MRSFLLLITMLSAAFAIPLIPSTGSIANNEDPTGDQTGTVDVTSVRDPKCATTRQGNGKKPGANFSYAKCCPNMSSGWGINQFSIASCVDCKSLPPRNLEPNYQHFDSLTNIHL